MNTYFFIAPNNNLGSIVGNLIDLILIGTKLSRTLPQNLVFVILHRKISPEQTSIFNAHSF